MLADNCRLSVDEGTFGPVHELAASELWSVWACLSAGCMLKMILLPSAGSIVANSIRYCNLQRLSERNVMNRAPKETQVTSQSVRALVRRIVGDAKTLRDKHVLNEDSAPVNYVCIFSKDKEEYDALLAVISTLGPKVDTTKMGLMFDVGGLDTAAGPLRVLKLRLPDPQRPERGDADFTVSNYPEFKKTYLSRPGFKLLLRPKFEMIELMDPEFDVLTYFSHPPMDEQLGLR